MKGRNMKLTYHKKSSLLQLYCHKHSVAPGSWYFNDSGCKSTWNAVVS